ncbi:immunoglobulin superfamily containing leucine-rich repeat protein-like [Haliotis cracherodii]|uniref:immunoglobulin superfamily containing leucine-rich repeat protein-like n=1 Tax=Haliotis cracherodii TaxID=6455 RepID=UPI0039EAA275
METPETIQHLILLFTVLVLVSSTSECPESCTCNLQISKSWVSCEGNDRLSPAKTWSDLVHVVMRYPLLKQLSYQRGLTALPYQIPRFDELEKLNLSQNYITELQSDAFTGMIFLQILDLGFNGIQKVDEYAFRGLENLMTLNLVHNKIASLSENTFEDLFDLRTLILKQNRITSLPQGIFRNLQNLKILDLSYNSLTYLSSKHFTPLRNLKEVHLNSNLVQSFHVDTVSALSHIPVLDLSNNPLDCSCAMSELKMSMAKRTTSLINPNATVCASPQYFYGQSIEAVALKDLNCTDPQISLISEAQVIPYQQDLYLPCQAEGSPTPAILWETPWGDTFARPSSFNFIGDDGIGYHSHHAYQAKNVILVSHVTLFENGTLYISKFRGYFAGNFTCIAVNPLSNSSATVHVEIFHILKLTFFQSLFISAYCSGGFLVFGIIVGSIKLIVCAIQRRLKAKKVEDKKESEKAVTVSDIVVVFDESDDRSDPSLPKTPLISPYMSTPNSPQKCTTPTEEVGWLPANIFDTLDEARWRLRYGVGRRMEKVRSHVQNQVQSIRESSTLYMQSIRDSGSSAANRVRTGIVVGVETMKYSVQSIREFCGTGDMRGQTISMISVSTDIDTDQRTEVIRSVTFV